MQTPRASLDRDAARPADVEEEEQESLLTGQPTQRRRQRRCGTNSWRLWGELGLVTWALTATVAAIMLAVVYQHELSKPHHPPSTPKPPAPVPRPPPAPSRPGGDSPAKPSGKRNLIFMVSDGMGPASLHTTRSFRQFTESLPYEDVLVLDQHIIGTSRTRSSSSLVTDSAAGATAFSCGNKSYNEAIAVLPDHSPCGTVLEAASLAGYKTGLVVTTRLTDATPACFASHANRRQYEDLIAEQEIGLHPLGRVTDLLLGGGRCHFLPKSANGSCRNDNTDLVSVAREKGFSYIDDRAGFDDLQLGSKAKLPLLGLLAETDIPYEIDRRSQEEVYPSLEEMARTALTALSAATKDSKQGFFLMIEGSRIDHAGHTNDQAAQVHEVLAYDRTFAAVAEFLERDPTPGVLVSTSDHETGGLSAARQLHKSYPEYLWYPGVLAKANHSAEFAAEKLHEYESSEGKKKRKKNEEKLRQYIAKDLLDEALGVTDPADWEVDALLKGDQPAEYVFADITSRRAQIGWSTHGHSGE